MLAVKSARLNGVFLGLRVNRNDQPRNQRGQARYLAEVQNISSQAPLIPRESLRSIFGYLVSGKHDRGFLEEVERLRNRRRV